MASEQLTDDVALKKAEEETHTATFPFDGSGGAADLILRSTDGVDFHINSVVLRLSSSQFSFSLDKQHDNDSLANAITKELVPQQFPEDSSTLDAMLRYCYPCEDPEPKTIDEVCNIIAAMSRHSMEDSTVMRRPAKVLMTDHLDEDPFRAYIMAADTAGKTL
jgi:hypothetical protein